ncbi:MAG: cysteine--tRNA ligase, partial [Erysipelotrichaceae bacterium]|nr:cysteine--tRNA ligase [Erysipelotrichaceae bacterium]
EAMNDDLNTPNAYKVIFDEVKVLNQTLRVREVDYSALADHYTSLKKMLDVLGIDIPAVKMSEEDKEIYRLWNEAKAAKDFEKADGYRTQLMEKGIL